MNERIFAVAHFADQGVLVLLAALTMVSVMLIVERWLVLRKAVAASLKHRSVFREAWARGGWNAVEQIARDGASLEGRVTAYALEHVRKHGVEGLEEAFHAISLVERPRLERSLGFLATVGSNAPYIGLFGTVLGIMKAFNDMANSADAGQQAVMAGISSALVATAAGLLAAIPAVLAFNYFQRQVKIVMSSLETCREGVMVWFKQQGRAQTDREVAHGS